MISMTLSECTGALMGRRFGADTRFRGCFTDSRAVRPEGLFFALTGPSFDGHAFVGSALGAGAAGAVVARVTDPHWPAVQVDDPRRSLGELAACWRARFELPLIAVTGSNGKTTTKEMIASILRVAYGPEGVLATAGNLNNDIGVPLTLLELGAEHRHAVIELGANHPGEIAHLSRLARPTVGVITQCACAHIEGFGSVDAVARAKGELLEQLPAHGCAVINADDAWYPLWRSLAGDREVLTFGLNAAAAVSADFRCERYITHLEIRTAHGRVALRLPVPGVHNVRNALAASAACLGLGVGLADIAAGLERMGPVAGRLCRTELAGGAQLIDDSYNANPASLGAALDVLEGEPGRRWLVLGDMAELGESAARYHTEAGLAAQSAGVERLYGLGRLSRHAVEAFAGCGHHFLDEARLCTALADALEADVTVLVKGSRSMRMERVVRALTGGQR